MAITTDADYDRWSSLASSTFDGIDEDEVDRLLAGLVARPAWQQDAACRGADPALFFPARGQSLGPARALCASCSVRTQCLDFATSLPDAVDGIWAGMGGRQVEMARRSVVRENRRTMTPPR